MAKEKATPPTKRAEDKEQKPEVKSPAEAEVDAEKASKTESDPVADPVMDPVVEPEPVVVGKEAKEIAAYTQIAQRYAKHYPNNQAFHITSDRQVFLEGDKAEAEAHQLEIGAGKIQTVNV